MWVCPGNYLMHACQSYLLGVRVSYYLIDMRRVLPLRASSGLFDARMSCQLFDVCISNDVFHVRMSCRFI